MILAIVRPLAQPITIRDATRARTVARNVSVANGAIHGAGCAQFRKATPVSKSVRAALEYGATESAPRPVSVVIADGHPITLEGVGRLFEREGFDVRARCHSGEECLLALQTHQPDILVLELQLPGKDGLTVLRELKQQEGLSTRAVLFTASPDEARVLEAMRLGARAVVLKEMDSRLLVECVRKVHMGEPWVERRSAGPLMQKLMRREAGGRQVSRDLTGREMEIVRLVASGLRNRGVAERLNVTEGTVKVHLHNIYEKLGIRGRLALILLARAKGLT